MTSAQERVDAYNRPSRALRTRLRRAVDAFRGKDVLVDQCIQRVGDGGEIHTLGKVAVAQWSVTDDPLVAQGEVAYNIEQGLGRVDWGPSEPYVTWRRALPPPNPPLPDRRGSLGRM